MFGRATYLLFELGWGLPVVGVQWLVGGACLWRHRRSLVLTVMVASIYLTCADAVAIQQHIWTLQPGRIVGLRLGNVPIEEAIFFSLTNSMVSQAVILVLRSDFFQRKSGGAISSK